MEIFISHYKDPYKPTSISWKESKGFFRSSPEQPEHFRSPWLVVYRVYKYVIFLWDYMKKL